LYFFSQHFILNHLPSLFCLQCGSGNLVFFCSNNRTEKEREFQNYLWNAITPFALPNLW
jgi:hypothetical protein